MLPTSHLYLQLHSITVFAFTFTKGQMVKRLTFYTPDPLFALWQASLLKVAVTTVVAVQIHEMFL